MENLKKDRKEQYRNRKVTGGIYSITCSGNGRVWIKSTKDITGQMNKFEFFVSTNFCPEPSMNQEWNKFGAASFSIEILEELEKGETQTDKEFADDIKVLYEMWTDNLKSQK